MKKIVIIMGSRSDKPFADTMIKLLNEHHIAVDVHIASAHKEPLTVLDILSSYRSDTSVVFITIAGRSNALSGFVAANCTFPVIACPPFSDKLDMLVNIHSTLQMPSNVPVMTVLDPANAVLAAMRILNIACQEGDA
ncbi:MAG: AIR carboxylase family protein [Sphaerochaetaceae bacterium]|jgi:5-(carboxyamino)imidazole ribonucleotide mutase|nr:AIR carboxylase family protein [Spirochaetales bacterium]